MVSGPNSALEDMDLLSYLEVARTLALDPSPAAQRSAGDRAYYAAYLFSRAQLIAKGYTSMSRYSGRGGHGNLSEDLGKHVGEDIGIKEDSMRRARNTLTYETGKEAVLRRLQQENVTTDDTIQWMLDAAQEIIQAVAAVARK